jgi:predicted acylesterase/phospholipase RssA/CRP-like cAMP-binding protein
MSNTSRQKEDRIRIDPSPNGKAVMAIDIFNLVKSSQIFASLDDECLHKAIKKLKKIYLRKNKILFQQGDISDGLYLLVSGRLVGLLKTKEREKFIGNIEPGQTIGEMGAIAHEPRAATIKALQDSILLKLSAEQFEKLCAEYPALFNRTMQNLMNRSRSLIDLLSVPEPGKKNIVIVAASKKFSLELFSARMTEILKNNPDNMLLSEYDPALQELSVTTLKNRINDLQAVCKKIIYILHVDESPLAKVALGKADMIYVAANGDEKPFINRITRKTIHEIDLAYHTNAELILLHKQEKLLPRHTDVWLKMEKFGLHHHIRLATEKDWQRLLRFINGTAVGVVLGGGGVRSWGHVGVLKALEEAGIPVDAIGGTSAGSIVAGHYAIHESSEGRHEKLRLLSAVTRKSVSLWNLTWPAASLYNATAYTETQKKIFGQVKIENLWLPFFSVACDLSKSTQVVNRRGLLWKKIRASTAVPGVYPPVIVNGRLRVDGGIVNNLPVDVMRKLSGSIGTVIAVQLVHNYKDDVKYKFPPSLPFWQVVLSKLGLVHRDYRFPHYIETFLRALLAGSSVKQRDSAAAADVLISPDLSAFNLLSVTEAEEDQLIEIGYQAAMAAIKKWKRKS